jgi:hypothetical protein
MGPYSPPRLQEETWEFISSQATKNTIAGCSGYQRPILMQHIPLFRASDATCGDGHDACTSPADVEAGAVGSQGRSEGSTPGYCRQMEGGTTYKGRLEALVAWHDDVMDAPSSRRVLAAVQPAYVLAAHLHAPCR